MDFADFCLALACGYCNADAGQPCRTLKGRVTTIHAARFWAAKAAKPAIAAAWEQGHTACSHSCSTYAGLGEPCVNPWKAIT